MKKALLAATFLLLTTISTTALPFTASANHEPDDPYEAMCQATASYTTSKYAYQDYAQNKEYKLLHLWGSCGDKPNYLEIDTVRRQLMLHEQQKFPQAQECHTVEFWASPKLKDSTDYWKCSFTRKYYVNKEGQVLKAVTEKPDNTKFLIIKQSDIRNFVITEMISAKVGGPLFESALGPIPCNSMSEDGGSETAYALVERGYMDFQKRK